jgi:hypothetical protein
LIPCMLHLKNHVTEKIITMILRCELDEFTGVKMEYVCHVESVIPTHVLRTVTSPSNWKLRYSKTGNEPIVIENIQV